VLPNEERLRIIPKAYVTPLRHRVSARSEAVKMGQAFTGRLASFASIFEQSAQVDTKQLSTLGDFFLREQSSLMIGFTDSEP
jgi:hypothetical protein